MDVILHFEASGTRGQHPSRLGIKKDIWERAGVYIEENSEGDFMGVVNRTSSLISKVRR